MSDKIPQQMVECDGCGTEFRRNQAIKGYGAEFPNFTREHGLEEGDEVTLCPDCGEQIERIPEV